MFEQKKPRISTYDEYLQVSLLQLTEIAIKKELSVEQVKAYFDEIISNLYKIKELDKKDKLVGEEDALS